MHTYLYEKYYWEDIMKNFVFYNPTKIVFGKDQTTNIGRYVYGTKCLLLYGKASIKQNGIYDKVVESLRKNTVGFVEKGGVQSNPVLGFVHEAIDLARAEKVDSILAVGGGSVIDTAKAIACGYYYEGDVWDFFTDKAAPGDALPLYVVLTLAATASEMNSGAVITNEKTKQKFNINAESLSPKVSILDPVNTFTVSKHYTAYGCVDAMVHLLEGYFTQDDPATPLQDGFVETLVRTLKDSTLAIMKQSDDYQARADFMWAATLALNGITTAGTGKHGFPNHMIGHSLSALYDLPHGASLSIVFPAWLNHYVRDKADKLAQFGNAIFGTSDPQKTIEALKQFFNIIGAPTHLSQVNIASSDIKKIAENAVMLAKKWGLHQYTEPVIEEVLNAGA